MIDLKNINKNFNKKKIFTDLNLSIDEGAITTIYGPSGSGKTTLINIIALIEKPDSGQVLFSGKTIKKNLAFIKIN